MTTPSHRLRETIFQVVNAAHPRPVSLDDLYQAVEQSVTFDEDDLAPPTLRGVAVSEPSLKRNVRNVLQHAKHDGTLVNIQRNAWRLPSPNPEFHLDESAARPIVRRAAEKEFAHGSVFMSTKQEHRYRVADVRPNRIEIERLDSPGPETRAGQPKFRKKLVQLYGSRCAVSGWGPECVLEAAHILLHAESGVNHSENGILLRSDLHDLFDDDLLRINPDSLSVVIDPVLMVTPYWAFQGAVLRPRRDGSHPSREYLRSRWTKATPGNGIDLTG